MDTLRNQHKKMLLRTLKQAASPATQRLPDTPPPAYIEAVEDPDLDEEDAESAQPHTISIDATTAIEGSQNTISLNAAEFGARLAATVCVILRSRDATQGAPFQISLNCGVKIQGDRNSIVPVQPGNTNRGSPGMATQVTKRKREGGEVTTLSATKVVKTAA